MNKQAIIYLIRNKKEDKVYVGSTNSPIEHRWDHHKLRLHSGTHNMRLQNAWDQTSEEDWDWVILERVPLHYQFVSEQHWLDSYESYKPENGYNISAIAGSFVPLTETEYNERHERATKELEDILQDLEARVSYRTISIEYGISVGLIGNLRKKYLPHLLVEDQEKTRKAAIKRNERLHKREERYQKWIKIERLLKETSMAYREIAKEAGCSLGQVGRVFHSLPSLDQFRRKRRMSRVQKRRTS